MAKVNWTIEAQRWVEDIFEYIAAENPRAAAEAVQGIYDRAQSIEDFPEIGYPYRVSNRNIRILLYNHYRITYLMKADGDIGILGIFHGSLDISRYQL